MTLPAPRTAGRAIAIIIASAAPVVMATAQARVIYDRVVMVHPAWPVWTAAAMAVGFELCILCTGLAVVVIGHRDRTLIAAEVFLIAMSVLVAVTGAFSMPAWVLPLTLALVPIQYACAFYAAHALFVHWYQPTPAAAAQSPREPRTAELAPVSAPPAGAPRALADASVNGHSAGLPLRTRTIETRPATATRAGPAPKAQPKRSAPRPSGQSVTVTAADYPARFATIAREHILEAMPAGQADQLVGAAAGVSAKTVQRARLAGQEKRAA